MAVMGLTNTLPRSSCGKCVQVLKDLVAGLDDRQQQRQQQQQDGNDNKTNSHGHVHVHEPPPLTLLRAIARSSEDHPSFDRWGQERRRFLRRQQPLSPKDNPLLRQQQQQPQHKQPQQSHRRPMLHIEETEDGVKLTIPVETTAPAHMTKWKHLEQDQPVRDEEDNKEENNTETDDETIEAMDDWITPLATSVRRDDDDETKLASGSANHTTHTNTTTNNPGVVRNPLTIELKCRKCETSGPEAGARAFLMGPAPLSIVLCHNRIDSERAEVEEILTHELIHLYDVQTLQLDLSDCETVAYSEVRAAREAECHRSAFVAAEALEQQQQQQQQSQPNNNKNKGLAARIGETLDKHVYRPYCARSIAMGATRNMFPQKGGACLNRVWETAYGDHRPFGRSPSERDSDSGSGGYNENENDAPSSGSGSSSSSSSSGTFGGTSGK